MQNDYFSLCFNAHCHLRYGDWLLLQRKTISGSCGGIGALGMEKACDCDDPCDDRKAKMAAEEARKEKEQAWLKRSDSLK